MMFDLGYKFERRLVGVNQDRQNGLVGSKEHKVWEQPLRIIGCGQIFVLFLLVFTELLSLREIGVD